MGNLSDKFKIGYLSMVILFALGVLVYLLDTWGVINLEEYVPLLADEAPVVPESTDDPTLLEWERLEKEEARIEEERLKLEEERLKLKDMLTDIEAKESELAGRESSLTEARTQFTEEQQAQFQRNQMIADMATRMTNMPPRDAVGIMAGFSNTDLVDVLLKMEENAVLAGQQSIVPFLMTLLPRDRAALVGTLMMDEQARRLPETGGFVDEDVPPEGAGDGAAVGGGEDDDAANGG